MNQGNAHLNQSLDAFNDPMAQFNQLNASNHNVGNGAVNSNQFNPQMNQMNQMSQMNQINQMNQMNQMGQMNQMNQMGQMNQMNQINQINQMNFSSNQSPSPQLNQMNQMNQMNNTNQMNQMNQQNVGGEGRGWNPAYVQSLLRKIQPGPGMTKQQRFQQLLKSGELTRTDVQILQRHQQMLRQAQSVRQKQAQQRALQQQQMQIHQQQPQQQQQQIHHHQQQQQQQQQLPHIHAPVAGKTVPGKSVPGKTVPGKTVPGKTLPGAANMGYQHSPVAGKSVPGKTLPPQPSTNVSIASTPLPMPVNLPVNSASSSQVNLTGASKSPIVSLQSPLNHSVNIAANAPVNASSNHNAIHHSNTPVNAPVNAPVNLPINAPVNGPVDATLKVANIPESMRHLTPEQFQQLKLQEQKRLVQQQQRQQQQKYFGVTAEQYEKLTPQQRQMLKMQYLRKKAKAQRFYESDEELLKKYENNPPSMDFHIHDDYYRFGHSDNMISKSNPAIKDFLKCVVNKTIPEALIEIIKDGNIPMYDGNIILRVYDHRLKNAQMLESIETSEKSLDGTATATATATATESTTVAANTLTGSANKQTGSTDATPTTKRKFKEYRTILRMTPAALYEDFCVATDTKMFGDSFVLTYESEILTASTRSVNLQPINNPYLQDCSLRPQLEVIKPQYDSENDTVIFSHRKDMRELVDVKTPRSRKSTKSLVLFASSANDKNEGNVQKRSLNYENYSYKPLHQDESQSNSKYEKLMLIMSQSFAHSSIASNKQTVEIPRFDRLRFVETLRQQKLLKKENSLKGVSGAQSPPLGYPGFGSIMNSMNSKPFIDGQGARGPSVNGFGINQSASNIPNANNGPSGDRVDNENGGADANSKGKATKGKGKATATKKKTDKPKKPRKPTKKQLAAQAAAEAAAQNGGVATPESSEPPKKKRAPAKKKAAAVATATPTGTN